MLNTTDIQITRYTNTSYVNSLPRFKERRTHHGYKLPGSPDSAVPSACIAIHYLKLPTLKSVDSSIDCIDYVTGIAHGGILRVPSMLYKMASIQADIIIMAIHILLDSATT